MQTPDSSSQALRQLISALLLAADGPLKVDAIVQLVGEAADDEEWPERVDSKAVDQALKQLSDDVSVNFGVELVEVAGGWRFRTKPSFGPLVRRLWPERKLRLSKAALEALAVIAYRQPCTRADVESVRGVDCGGVVRSLLEKGLLKISGKSEDVGRPLLYRTTPLFLETFSLKSISSLPTLRSIEELEAEEAARLQAEADPAVAARFASLNQEHAVKSAEDVTLAKGLTELHRDTDATDDSTDEVVPTKLGEKNDRGADH